MHLFIIVFSSVFSVKLNLEGYSPLNLFYLQNGDTYQDEAEDAARFLAWKACLGMLSRSFRALHQHLLEKNDIETNS